MCVRVCFFINPVAGMGGPLGLKGSDNLEISYIKEHIARSPSIGKAKRFIDALIRFNISSNNRNRICIYTAPSLMGYEILNKIPNLDDAGLELHVLDLDIPLIDGVISIPQHTREFIRKMQVAKCSVLVFVGGDGTARDVLDSYRECSLSIPVIGVPAGVKVYSGIFALSPEAAALLLFGYLDRKAETILREVVDVDEKYINQGSLRYRIYGELPTLYMKPLLQDAKSFTYEGSYRDIARYFAEEFYDPKNNVLYVFGPGRTINEIARYIGIEKSIFGFDVVLGGNVVGRDVSSFKLIKLIEELNYEKKYLVLTPIAGTNFIIGRATGQLTPEVLGYFQKNEIVIVSPEWKVKQGILYVDSGDPIIDRRFEGYYRVLVGYREEKIVKVISVSSITL